MPASKGCTTPVLQNRWTSPDGCGKREIDAGYQRCGWVREQHCCLSSIVVAEIRYGLAKRSAATRLQALTEATLETLEILPWTEACTRIYGQLRVDLERHGKPLSADRPADRQPCTQRRLHPGDGRNHNPRQVHPRHRCFTGPMLLGNEVLLGAIPMDDMDLVLRPHLQSVDVNPESPNIPVLSSAFRFVGKQAEIERDQPNRCSGPDD